MEIENEKRIAMRKENEIRFGVGIENGVRNWIGHGRASEIGIINIVVI